MNRFSVTMSVYKNDKPAQFNTAIMSIYNQTCTPDEIVLIVDGPIPMELEAEIENVSANLKNLKIVRFPKNRGHAAARQAGLENATHEIVAIMDSDDIADPCRFEVQLALMEKFEDVAVIGSIIHEFIDSVDNVVGTRFVPQYDKEIKEYLRKRCPMNLMTVMYRKSSVMDVGGFIDWYCEEDYYLWIRLALANYKFYNHQESLVNVRVGKEMYQRRGGLKYFLSEAKLQKYMKNQRVISFPQYIYNVAIRFILQVVMPNSLRGWVFQKFARR